MVALSEGSSLPIQSSSGVAVRKALHEAHAKRDEKRKRVPKGVPKIAPAESDIPRWSFTTAPRNLPGVTDAASMLFA